ncbi:MAG TPA: PLP-dependent aminotransferase family protein [Myxococcaceae bacterium]|jgi:GntR family transcriptional regulator/MocR family aminotransferase
MRKWQLLTSALDPRQEKPLFLQLSDALGNAIRDGRLKPGDALPGTRQLATRLHVHRNTIVAGYNELVSEGLVSTRHGGGTFVTGPAPVALRARPGSPTSRAPSYEVAPPLPPPPMIPPDPGGALMMFRGVPDVRLLPADALARGFRRALSRHGRKLLSYGDPRGHAHLRAELATLLSHTRGLSTSLDDVVVTRGSQQALDLIARAILSPGDVVGVEALGNPPSWYALRLAGAELEPLPVDDQGLDIDALEALLRRRTLRAVYVTPHHQFPTNRVMPPERRARLGALASEHRFAIIEDDYDHEFHYEGDPVAPIAASAGGANVVYVSSLSKVLAPGLRMGFIVAPRPVLDRVVSFRAVTDMQGDATMECAIAELFEEGELVRHVGRMRTIYRSRRDALAAALEHHLRGALRFHVPDGGMALWAAVEPGIDLPRWERAGEGLGVIFRGARIFDFFGQEQPFLRLGFTYHDEEELDEAAARMARALDRD